MSALKENKCYGLSSRKLLSHGGGNVSVFHVKLTDSASRALETFQNTKSRLSPPTVCFAGNQGRFTIPCSENEARSFTFGLTNVARESPHGSFHCVHQLCTGSDDNHLSSVGVIQKKVTVNATDESYHKARQSMAQAEEETRSRGAIVIKHTGRVQGKKVMVRAPAPALASLAKPRHSFHSKLRDPKKGACASEPRKEAFCGTDGRGGGVVEERPLRERVLHLLALRPYRRPELVLRLQKDGLTEGDKDMLDSLLLEVGQINSRDSAYTLQGCLYKELQRNWPGYTAGDQQLLKRILVRRLFQPHHLSVPETQVSPLRDTPNSSPAHPNKPSLAEDYTDPLANKRPRISHASSRPASAPPAGGDVAAATKGSSRGTPLDPRRLLGSLAAVQEAEAAGRPGLAPSALSEGPAPLPLPCVPQSPPSPVRTPCVDRHDRKRKRRRSKHKHKDQEKVKGEDRKRRRGDSSPEDSSLDCADPSGMFYDSSVLQAANRMTDYLSKYTVIRSPDQRQSYKQDFNEEYSEYRSLHSGIDGMTRQFMELDAQLKRLRHGSHKYKTIHNQILQKYRTIKKSNPNYNQDKIRCEYLHNKLAHIKKLISEYDRQQLCFNSS